MNFWKKLIIISILTVAVFFTQGIIDHLPAHAALHKFSFNGEQANGYFIFDDSIRGGAPIRPDMLSEYDGSVVEYAVNIGDEISEQGSQSPERATHDEARTIVTLLRPELVKASPNLPKDSPQDDEFILFVPKVARQSKYALSVRFRYPENTFQNSVAQPKNVPNQALMSVHPYWNFPITMGKVKFEQPVNTLIEDIF
ncbi:hypothetical protein FD724_29620 [Nostoc sp. C057]|uniref:hypothetical protein n=1 Tax=Nostoc sp. C057 TaxID=2576903 RepID=UPI0015C39478|nr:hypothetical protein [Nostoc sp. C057]QLE51800.1 hypothetical protein FD724_29620 [Nostoc sp. C057]